MMILKKILVNDDYNEFLNEEIVHKEILIVLHDMLIGIGDDIRH